jgi:hypothetical protein
MPAAPARHHAGTKVRHNLVRVVNLIKIFARDPAISAKIRIFFFPVPCPAALHSRKAARTALRFGAVHEISLPNRHH